MSRRESIFIVCVIIVILSLFCFIEVNCNDLKLFSKFRRSMLNASNVTTASSVEQHRLRSLEKQRRRVLLDSLISLMSNNSKIPTADWKIHELRRSPSFNLKETFHRFSTANNSNGNSNINDKDKDRHNLPIDKTPNYKLLQAETQEEQTTSTSITTRNQDLKPAIQSELLNVYNIQAQLRELLSGAEYTNITINCIGRTAEYNEIIMLQATQLHGSNDKKFRTDDDNKYANDVPQKKIVFIVHGLSVMGFKEVPCLIVLKNFLLLLKTYFKHLDKFDIYLVPLANPDGLAYSYHFPLWNKNVSPQDACPGVALDRNFDIAFENSESVQSCSQQYPGDRPFSEPETQAIRDVFHDHGHKIIAYIHVHGGGYHEHIYKGDAVLYPKGFTETAGDDDKYIDLKGDVEEMMKNASFKSLSVAMDTLYSWYGKVNGSSVDYASTVYGIPYALEFVMQLYEVDPYAPSSSETIANAAQDAIWHRLIDTVFKHIYNVNVKHIRNLNE